ncbi:MAG: hypothetical protein D6701_15615, partial [Gemmatimonadetes bacterium]
MQRGVHAHRSRRRADHLLGRRADGHPTHRHALRTDGACGASLGSQRGGPGQTGLPRRASLRLVDAGEHGRHAGVQRKDLRLHDHRPGRDRRPPPGGRGPHRGRFARSRLRRDRVRGARLVTGDPWREAGFTLLEALIALTLSAIIVILVSTVFLVQNDFYATVAERSYAQESVRSFTQIIASEIRGAARGGMLLAEGDEFAVRVPMAMGGVCDAQALQARVHMPGLTALDQGETGGYGVRAADGTWTFQSGAWSSIVLSTGAADAGVCAAAGAD